MKKNIIFDYNNLKNIKIISLPGLNLRKCCLLHVNLI